MLQRNVWVNDNTTLGCDFLNLWHWSYSTEGKTYWHCRKIFLFVILYMLLLHVLKDSKIQKISLLCVPCHFFFSCCLLNPSKQFQSCYLIPNFFCLFSILTSIWAYCDTQYTSWNEIIGEGMWCPCGN